MIKNPLVGVDKLINGLKEDESITLNRIVEEFEISPTKAHSRYILKILRDKNIKVISTSSYLKVNKKDNLKNIKLSLITNYDDIDIFKERLTLQKDINLYMAMLEKREYEPKDRVEEKYLIEEIKEGEYLVFDALCSRLYIIESTLNSLIIEHIKNNKKRDGLNLLIEKIDTAKKRWQIESIRLKELKKEDTNRDDIFYQKLKVAYKKALFKREVFNFVSVYELVNRFIKLSYEDAFRDFKLSEEESQKILYQIKIGMTKVKIAKTEIVKSTLRLLVAIAKRYENKNFSAFDLIEEGNIKLIEALDMFIFEHQKGYKFSVYATLWIKNYFEKIIEYEIKRFSILEHLKHQKRD